MKKIKIVMKVHMNCEKCLTKAKKVVAAGFQGVESVAVEGDDKEEVVVVGDQGVDAVRLVKKMRKKVEPYVVLLGVEEVKPKGKEEEKPSFIYEYRTPAYSPRPPQYMASWDDTVYGQEYPGRCAIV